jgi:NitT/TauT family transport system substrate-binding protein
VVTSGATAPIYVAQEKGYFKAAGLDTKIVPFDAAVPVAVAVASGDIDFGYVGPTGALYTLAGQGVIRIIGGGSHETPGFQLFGFVVGTAAYDKGLHGVTDLPGHSVALTQIGSAYHYCLALLTEKYGVDIKSVRLLPLQSIPNIASALTGGQADAAVLNATASAPLRRNGAVKLVAWVGDETPWQAVVVFTNTKTANDHRDTVDRFLGAYHQGAREFHDAFTAANGSRADQATAPATLAIIAKYTGMTEDQARAGLAYVDADGRIDAKDIAHQIAWYKSQGMIKGEVDPAIIIDKRFAVSLPEPRS